MDDIKRIQRPSDVPDYGLLNDLLWSDPSDTALDWEDNERGVSYCFGKGIVNDFLLRYDMDLICRAHMVVEDGYEFWNERTLVTVFSAPNYCGGKSLAAFMIDVDVDSISQPEFDNYGACMRSLHVPSNITQDLTHFIHLVYRRNYYALSSCSSPWTEQHCEKR